MNNYKWSLALSFMAILTVLVSGCGNSNSSQPGMGTLGVSLTDAAAGGFDAVNVTVREVRVHRSSTASESDSGWSDITLNPRGKSTSWIDQRRAQALGQTSLRRPLYPAAPRSFPNTGNTIANSVVLSGTTTELPLLHRVECKPDQIDP
jgi:hypothetical protein